MRLVKYIVSILFPLASTLLIYHNKRDVIVQPQIVYTLPVVEVVYTPPHKKIVYTIQRQTYLEVPMLVTAYSPYDELDQAHWSTKDFITSIGVDWRTHPYGIAADPRVLPYGTPLIVPGYMGVSFPYRWWRVDDTGGAMRRSWSKNIIHIDVRFKSSAWAARWGNRWINILVDTSHMTEYNYQQLMDYVCSRR